MLGFAINGVPQVSIMEPLSFDLFMNLMAMQKELRPEHSIMCGVMKMKKF